MSEEELRKATYAWFGTQPIISLEAVTADLLNELLFRAFSAGHKFADAAKDAEIAKLRRALIIASNQLQLVYDDALNQAGGYGLLSSDGRSFSCLELNRCDEAARNARAALGGGAA
ncbi:hypothetical protein [Rhizobium sp. S163]|uniref:hypothetical protein n=1 Tax=Rhizobium sp. S163 TaxID=3055039 RepID=UPI0025A9BEC4|nr:hypothetical protein [Rhizobium sp. S163]MDM9644502.1 hypothetical protein [Rhizobium sp. S163]